MHMADALVSPTVGGTCWVLSGGLIAFCARRVRQALRDDLVAMMGVLGAFIFAVQMINFSIPGTGSSGHLGGGLILAVLLGPYAAFLVIASVLVVQALFFGDGGLLALGCNIINMGLFPAFIAYPLIYKPLSRGTYSGGRAIAAAVMAAVGGLLMGALFVVIETRLSGISAIPFTAFLLLMLPIHLAIGAVEGFATAAVVGFVAHSRPEALPTHMTRAEDRSLRPVLMVLGLSVLLIGGVLSWFASTHPDGLEWSIGRVTGTEILTEPGDSPHAALARVQERTAFLPDYTFRHTADANEAAWPAVEPVTSLAGLVGGVLTLCLVLAIGLGLKWNSRARARRLAASR